MGRVRHLEAIAEYLALTSPAAAEHVLERLQQRAEQASVLPESGRVVPEYEDEAYRELIEPPYRLVYRREPRQVVLVAVLHSRQNVRPPPP